jgi:hypothetical protein
MHEGEGLAFAPCSASQTTRSGSEGSRHTTECYRLSNPSDPVSRSWEPGPFRARARPHGHRVSPCVDHFRGTLECGWCAGPGGRPGPPASASSRTLPWSAGSGRTHRCHHDRFARRHPARGVRRGQMGEGKHGAIRSEHPASESRRSHHQTIQAVRRHQQG